MSPVKLKLKDDFNNFLGLMLAVHWQFDILQQFERNSHNSRFFKVYYKLELSLLPRR